MVYTGVFGIISGLTAAQIWSIYFTSFIMYNHYQKSLSKSLSCRRVSMYSSKCSFLTLESYSFPSYSPTWDLPHLLCSLMFPSSPSPSSSLLATSTSQFVSPPAKVPSFMSDWSCVCYSCMQEHPSICTRQCIQINSRTKLTLWCIQSREYKVDGIYGISKIKLSSQHDQNHQQFLTECTHSLTQQLHICYA